MMHTLFSEYSMLRTKLDARVSELECLHMNYVRCKKGCYSCCINFRILPIEFYAICESLAAQSDEFQGLVRGE